jgi:POT family proton-dependent oligopeptide transporter
MLVATVVFWLGRRQYVLVPPGHRTSARFRGHRLGVADPTAGAGAPGLWIAVAGVVVAPASFTLVPVLGFVIAA